MKEIESKPKSLVSKAHKSEEVLVAIVYFEQPKVIIFDHFVTWASCCKRTVQSGIVADEIQRADKQEPEYAVYHRDIILTILGKICDTYSASQDRSRLI